MASSLSLFSTAKKQETFTMKSFLAVCLLVALVATTFAVPYDYDSMGKFTNDIVGFRQLKNLFTALKRGFNTCLSIHGVGELGGLRSWLSCIHHRPPDQHLGTSESRGSAYRSGGWSLQQGGSAYRGSAPTLGTVGRLPLELGKRAVCILLECFLV